MGCCEDDCDYFDITKCVLGCFCKCCISDTDIQWRLRMIFGLFVAGAEFGFIVFLNIRDYLASFAGKAFFIGIIVYLVIVYLPITIVGCRKTGFRTIKLYKVCDLIFNLLLAGFAYYMFYVVKLEVAFVAVTESISGLEVLLDLISICWCRKSY